MSSYTMAALNSFPSLYLFFGNFAHAIMHLGHISVNYSPLFPNTNLSQLCIFLDFVIYLILTRKYTCKLRTNSISTLLFYVTWQLCICKALCVLCVRVALCADVHICWKCRCQCLHTVRGEHGCLALSPSTLFPWDGSLIEPGLRLTVSKPHESSCLCPFPSTGVTGMQAATPRLL